MNQKSAIKEDLKKLKYNNLEGENLLENNLFQESDIKRLDKELSIPYEMDYIEGGNTYNLNKISRLYFHQEMKMFDYNQNEKDEEYIDFYREQDILKIEIIETVSFVVMLKMKKTMRINIDSQIFFVVFTKNHNLLISVREMYSKNNVKILKIVRNYFDSFPFLSENENLEKEIFISNNEIYYINDSIEFGGKSLDIPSNSNFYISYEKGQFIASTNVKDSCYLCFRKTSSKFPIYVNDEIFLCKFNENDFIFKILSFSEINSIKIINNSSSSLQRPSHISNSSNQLKQDMSINSTMLQDQLNYHLKSNTQIINPGNRNIENIDSRNVINNRNFTNFIGVNKINSNQPNNNKVENVNINQINNENLKKMKQIDINEINIDKKTELVPVKNIINIKSQPVQGINDIKNEDNPVIQNEYNVDNFASFKKLLEIQKQEKEKMRTYCRYCNYSKRADYFLHSDCRKHKLDNNICIKCDHIICKECSVLYRRCFFDNELVKSLERI